MIEEIAHNPWHAEATASDWARAPETLGVFATRATVASGAYQHEVEKRAPRLRIFQQACPDLAGCIEAGADADELDTMVARYVGELLAQLEGSTLDSVVLGCTHYPLVEPLFRAHLPANVRILSQPLRTAEALTAYLFRHPEMKRFGALPAEIRAYTTGNAELVTQLASRYFPRHLRFQPLPRPADRMHHHA